MNNLKVKVYKTILKEVSEKYEGIEEFINSKIKEICSQEKLSGKELIYFLFSCLAFSSKIVSWHKSVRNL